MVETALLFRVIAFGHVCIQHLWFASIPSSLKGLGILRFWAKKTTADASQTVVNNEAEKVGKLCKKTKTSRSVSHAGSSSIAHMEY